MIPDRSLVERARAAAAVAATYADATDIEARFPRETVTALQEQGLLGLLVPIMYGGAGGSLADAAVVCRMLGHACGSSALIYAMHQIQVACIIAGAGQASWPKTFLQRLARDQMLLASVTSEVGIGGNIRASLCAPIYVGNRLTLAKRSSAISYGEYADALVITARRDPNASASDQVLIVAEKSDVVLTETGRWDTLGMRGTSSKAFDVAVTIHRDQVLPIDFGDIAQHVMLPTSHLLWGAAWLGIASDAAEKARAFLRRQAQSNPGIISAGALRFEKAASLLVTIRARLDAAMREYESRPLVDLDALPLGFLTEVNGLKIMVSEATLEVVQHAMMICGIAGYQYGTPYSIGRHLRDLQSAPLMVNNDRIAGNVATLLVAQRTPLMKV